MIELRHDCVPGCQLKKTRNGADPCTDSCARCGWNESVAAERKKKIRKRYVKGRQFVVHCPYCGQGVDITDEVQKLVAL